MSLADGLLAGDLHALARLATHVENDDVVGRAALSRLNPHTGRAHFVGVTGPPGAGKSTLVNAMIGAYRDANRRVGVIAVDPSSPLTGGAALGDRVRMMERHADEGVFIRSMASRGQAGGLGSATTGVARLLDAAGFDPILIETVGAGQDEFAIARQAHTTVLLQVPGLGDSIQSTKAGILEIGDVLVVNKADREGADALHRDLTEMVCLGVTTAQDWAVPVLRVSATTGEGVPALVEAIDLHRGYLRQSGKLLERERAMAVVEVATRLQAEVERRLQRGEVAGTVFEREIAEVLERRAAPHEAVERLLALFDFG